MLSSKTKSMILATGGLWLIVTAATVLVRMHPSWGARLIVPSVFAGVVGLILTAVGIRNFIVARRGGPREDYRHTYRLFGALMVVLVTALAVRALVIPPSYGEHGHFRGTALAAARNITPGHQGKKRCARCHAKVAKLHAKDAHAGVQCEACHGMGRDHIAGPGKKMLRKDGGKEACLTCHRRLSARPGAFGQVDWKQHYAFAGVKDFSIKCVKCHNPHEPLFMDRDLKTARLHPLIHRCRDCHTGPLREPSATKPKSHPAIFQCKDCHKDVVKDFAKRAHKKVRCTTCHVFFKESDHAGRIIRDSDPRFCLLCHRKASFRKDSPPGIEWPDHREDMGGTKTTRCIDCHQEEKIHKVAKKGEAGE